MIDPKTFRQLYPEFNDLSKYPDAAITQWATIAKVLLNTTRWGIGATIPEYPPTNEYDIGMGLFVAHNLAIEQRNKDTAANGGVPGENTGPLSAKSVGSVSASYDTQAGIVTDAAHWNLTTYGTRFVFLARMMGAGPLQVGIGCNPVGVGGAWPGPYCEPEPGGSSFG